MAEKKKLVYEMWFCYVDNNNKFQNALADVNYQINSKERMKAARDDLRRLAGGNLRCIVNYQILRKKYVKENA